MGAGGDDVRDAVTILTFFLLIAAFVMIAVAVASAANGVQRVAWRRFFPTRLGLFTPPANVAPEVWRQHRKFHLCLSAATGCFMLLTIILEALVR